MENNVNTDELETIVKELKPNNKFIQVDNYIYNLDKLAIISETDADYEDNTKFYFNDGESVDFPKALKETVAFLSTKGIEVSLVNDEEGFVLGNVINAYFDEDGFNVSYSNDDVFTFEIDDEDEVKKIFSNPESFYVELSEEDEVEESYDEEEVVEDSEDFECSVELTEKDYLDPKLKKETYQPKSSVKINHSPLDQQRKEGVSALMSLGLKAIVVTAVILGVIGALGYLK